MPVQVLGRSRPCSCGPAPWEGRVEPNATALRVLFFADDLSNVPFAAEDGVSLRAFINLGGKAGWADGESHSKDKALLTYVKITTIRSLNDLQTSVAKMIPDRHEIASVHSAPRLPDGSLSVLVGRHGAMNPAGRVRWSMSAPVLLGYAEGGDYTERKKDRTQNNVTPTPGEACAEQRQGGDQSKVARLGVHSRSRLERGSD